MGYKIQSKLYNLVFEDEFAGLKITTTGLPFGDYLKLASATESTDADAAQAVVDIFVSKLVTWNMQTETGESVPPTAEGMKMLEIDLIMAIIGKWTEAVGGVSRDLGKGSPSGGTFQEESLGMELA